MTTCTLKTLGAVHHVAADGKSGIRDGITSGRHHSKNEKNVLCAPSPLLLSGTQSIFHGGAAGSLRILGPHLKRYAVFLVWRLGLYLCFRARSYHKATEHLNTIPEWKDAGQFSVLVVSEWSMWISDLILNFQFVAAWRLLSNPLADDGEPLLAQLNSTLVSRVRASLVLQRLVRKSLVYIRWTLRKRRL